VCPLDVTTVYAEGEYDLSMEQVPGVIALEDELIIQALLMYIQ
jgi:hypothetical protein